MRRQLLAACLALIATPAVAGNYLDDFNDGVANNATLNGSATVNAGSVRLTEAANSQQGTLVLNDLDAGVAVRSFNANFKMQLGPGTTTPADGVSFNFGTLANNDSFGEQGIANGLVVSFDIFDNAGGEAPAIDLIVDSAVVATGPSDPIVNGSLLDVSVKLDPDGTVDLTYNGNAIFTNVASGFVPVAGDRFGFGGRTGGLNAEQRIDDLNITTVPIPEPGCMLLSLSGMALLAAARRHCRPAAG